MKTSNTCVYMADQLSGLSLEDKEEILKMLRGELYDANAKGLVEMRQAMQIKQRAYAEVGDRGRRAEIVKSFFYKTGDEITIEPNFFADYGKFISVGMYFIDFLAYTPPASINLFMYTYTCSFR